MSRASLIPTDASARTRIAGALGAFAIGIAVAAQARINGALGVRLDDGVAAALISFGCGLLVLCVVVAGSARLRAGAAAARAALGTRLPWWQYAGGMCGAFYVASQGLSAAVLGVALFGVAVIAGQLTSSLVVDRLGLGPGGATAVTVPRVAGSVLALAGVIVASWGQFHAGDVWLVLLPAAAGLGIAWQQAMNGHVGAVTGPLVATWINFGVGTVALTLALVVEVAVRGLPERLPPDPWLYLGGFLGIAFIAMGVVVVRWVGVLLLGLGTVAGQMVGGVLLDVLFPAQRALTVPVLVGCGITVLAVLVAAGRSPARRPAALA